MNTTQTQLFRQSQEIASGLHLVHGPFTLKGDQADLNEMATHLSDVLHVNFHQGQAELFDPVLKRGDQRLARVTILLRDRPVGDPVLATRGRQHLPKSSTITYSSV